MESIRGIPKEQFLRILPHGRPILGGTAPAALVYSVGRTQHDVGAQYIRAGSIIQLQHRRARAGRQHRGLDRHPTRCPHSRCLRRAHSSLAAYIESIRADKQKGFFCAGPYVVSLLKEYWGDAATQDNDFPTCRASTVTTAPTAPSWTWSTARSSATSCSARTRRWGRNGRLQRLGMANLDWLVVRDLAMIDSATFWKNAPEIETGEIVPEQCRTEVFFFPAASHVEKEGTFTQTQRMLQWREKAVEPTGDQRSELWFFYHLGRRIRQRLAGSTDERDRPLLELALDLRDARRRAVVRGCAAPYQVAK